MPKGVAMRCLVVGGAGFIGSRLTKRLYDGDLDVYVIDNLCGGHREEIDFIDDDHFFDVDINSSACISVFDHIQASYVFHLAALPRVQYSIAHPVDTTDTNITGTVKIIECARNSGCIKFVYSSSSSVYGDQDELPLREDMCPNALSPYALQKLTGELYAGMAYDIYELPTISLRYFNVYGPTQRADSAYAAAIPKLTLQALAGEDLTVFGDGEQTRDYTYVEDVVDANLAAMEAGLETYGKVYNVGGGTQISVNDIVDKIKSELGIEVNVKNLHPVVESKHTKAFTGKSKKELGWSVKVGFDEGIKETIKGVRKRYKL